MVHVSERVIDFRAQNINATDDYVLTMSMRSS